MTMVMIGTIVGILVGATSTGGGAVLTPALVLVVGVPASMAIGTDVFIAFVMKLFGAGFYALRGAVHVPTVLRLAMGSVPGAAVGLWILTQLPSALLESFLRRSLGVLLVFAGVATFVRLASRGRTRPRRMPPTPWTVALGFATGVLVTMTSVGSGSVLLCVLTFFFPIEARILVGTDLLHALIVSGAATAGHMVAGRVDPSVVALVLIGAVPGVLIGAHVATALPERALRVGLAALLIVIGMQFSFGAVRAQPRGASHVAPAPTAMAK